MLSIQDPEISRLAHHLAARRGTTVDAVIRTALEHEWQAEMPTAVRSSAWMEQLLVIANQIASFPDLDTRPADEIIGYDDNGLPA